MANVRREVKDYNDAVSNGSFVCQRDACPGCLGSPDFARHDCARRQFRIRVFDLRLDEFVVEVVPSWRVRFRCRPCQKVFTEYPPFALPHKRFVKQDVLAKALNYLADQQPDGQAATYRESVRDKRVPPGYANNNKGRQLSHVTLWRWLSWLGSLKNLVQRATQLVLQKDPQADLHRKSCPVAHGKTRSPQRRQTLEQATMTLHAADAFPRYFGVSLFTHLGTAGALA
jgi:hypothetical protein